MGEASTQQACHTHDIAHAESCCFHPYACLKLYRYHGSLLSKEGKPLFGKARLSQVRSRKATLCWHSLSLVQSSAIWGRRKDAARSAVQGFSRPALHARSLGFVHPVTGEHLKFDTHLPDDFQSVLTALQDVGAELAEPVGKVMPSSIW